LMLLIIIFFQYSGGLLQLSWPMVSLVATFTECYHVCLRAISEDKVHG
jgi:hypothetical protein